MGGRRVAVTAVPPDQLAFLQGVDSATISNAVERFAVRDRTEGYIGGGVRCLFPDLGVMVGHALVVTMDNRPGAVADRESHWRLWEALDALPPPVVLVVKDLSGSPGRCAYIGEVMGSIARRCGAVGIVTDGGVRDVAELRRIGFHCFASYTVVSHGNFSIAEIGGAATLEGQRVVTGDLLHGDACGVVLVPREVLPELPEAVATIRRREEQICAYTRTPPFTLEGLRATGGY